MLHKALLSQFCTPRTSWLSRLNNWSPLSNYRWNRPSRPRKCSAVCTWYDTTWRQMKLTHAYSRRITTFTISVTSCIVTLDALMRLLSLRIRQWVSLRVRMPQFFFCYDIKTILLNQNPNSRKSMIICSFPKLYKLVKEGKCDHRSKFSNLSNWKEEAI